MAVRDSLARRWFVFGFSSQMNMAATLPAVYERSNRDDRSTVVIGGTLRVGSDAAGTGLGRLEHGEDRRQSADATAIALFANLFEPGGGVAAAGVRERLLIAALERAAIAGVERFLIAEARADVGQIGAGDPQGRARADELDQRRQDDVDARVGARAVAVLDEVVQRAAQDRDNLHGVGALFPDVAQPDHLELE